MFENLLRSWPFLKSIEVYLVKYKFSFPKTEFAIFQFQAPGNPDAVTEWEGEFVTLNCKQFVFVFCLFVFLSRKTQGLCRPNMFMSTSLT